MKASNHFAPLLLVNAAMVVLTLPAIGQSYSNNQNSVPSTAGFGSVNNAIDAHDLDAGRRMVGSSGAFKGTVSKIYSPASGNIVIIDFDPDYRTAMTAVIMNNDFSRFNGLNSLMGQTLVVKGTFEDYQGKIQIQVSDPEQIQIVSAGTGSTGSAGAKDFDWANAPEIKAAGAFTVVAASDEAALCWFPMKDAAMYAVKRTTFADADPQTIAYGLTGPTYFDRGLKPKTRYEYVVCGFDKKGSVIAKEIAAIEPESGAAVFVDPLTDWSNAGDHTSNLSLTNADGVAFVKRTSADTGSITYNLPGTVDVSFEVDYQSDLASQVTLDTSSDGNNWTPQPLSHTDPVQASATDQLTVCSATSLPPRTNFVRISLNGASVNSVKVGAVRATYGRTDAPSLKTASTASR